MAAKNNIGILTGGGDVPGLNPVIKSVVYRAKELGREVIGIRKGWEGLTNMDTSLEADPVYIRPLTRENTRTIDRTGGTVLHTSRTNPRKMSESKLPKYISPDRVKKLPFDGKHYDFTPIVLENLERLGITCLVTIGGDDTLSFSAALSAAGMPVIAIPKTMDNDVQGTEYCIGFSTAITRAKELITRQRTTLGSHERIGDFPHLRARRGLHRAVHRVCHFDALLDSRIPVRPRPRGHDSFRRQTQQPEPLCADRDRFRRRHVERRHAVQEYGEADAYGHRKKMDIGQALGEEIRRSAPATKS